MIQPNVTRTDLKEVRARHQHALASSSPAATLSALSDIPVLYEEVSHLRLLGIARLARATMAAAADQERDPLYYRLTASHRDKPW